MHNQQLAIARAVIPLLRPGGVLVYRTCSLEGEENEAVVERLSREFSQLKLDAKRFVLPSRDGFDGAFAARFNCR
jgi:16S rRNA C967 or C1407 C5-methylase (RsmB/RsmF family)